MRKEIVLAVLVFILVITNVQAMSNHPSTLVLEGNTNEWLNGTLYFSDVPTKTLLGYEKWTLDGKTLNRSIEAKDVGIELVYPKIVNIENKNATISISARTNESSNFTGAIFYRTEEQVGIAAGTWIKIITTDSIQQEGNFLDALWNWITGFVTIAKAETTIMNTTVTVLDTTSHSGGGGGSSTQKDTDGDGISDIKEMIGGTDWKDPCDPNPNCGACLVIRPTLVRPSLTPTAAPKPVVVTEKQKPSLSGPVVISPVNSEEKPSLLFYGFCVALVGAGVVFLIYRLRKRALKKGEEEEEIKEEIEGEVYWE